METKINLIMPWVFDHNKELVIISLGPIMALQFVKFCSCLLAIYTKKYRNKMES